MQTLNFKIQILLTIVFASITASHSVSAATVKSKGQAFVVYNATLGPKKEDKDATIRAAMTNAIERYEATLSGERAELYRRAKKRNHFRDVNLVTGYTLIFDEIDKKAKRYTVIVEATINTDAIEQAFRKLGPASPVVAPVCAPEPAAGEETYMAFVFVARELAPRKKFDNLLHKPEKQEATSKLLYLTERTYRTFTTTAVDKAVTKVLRRANYEPVAAIDAGLDVDAFKGDFSFGDISSATMRAAVAKCRENGIRYLAVANMEVGLPSKDPDTDLQKVVASVTVKVSDLARKFPKTLVYIAGTPYYGMGADAELARSNTINAAAEKSAKQLVDQLRLRGVKP